MDTQILIDKIKMLGELKNEKAKREAYLDEIKAQVSETEKDLIQMLETAGLQDFNSPFGKVGRSEKNSFTTPKTIDDKKALMEYLRATGGDELLNTYLSFNSKSINKYANDLLKLREDQGDFNVEIPGLGTPKKYYTLSFTGGKKS